jgi:glycosyltransferase involved in cell wall biosynthesis
VTGADFLRQTMPETLPSITIVVPVHNEDAILEAQVLAMRSALERLPNEHEILLIENGSSDGTAAIGRRLAGAFPVIRLVAIARPDYGFALRRGILEARHDLVIIFNVEFWSIEFVSIAVAALQTRVLVIGSKSAPGAHDDRPVLRRLITRAYNVCLRAIWGFRGTDTHGMKAFHRLQVAPIVEECQCSGFVFDTELVLRCERAGLRRLELPTDVKEVRAPSLSSLINRVPNVLRNLVTLWRALR